MRTHLLAATAIAAAMAPLYAAADGYSDNSLLRRVEQLEAQNEELRAMIEETQEKTDEVAATRPVIKGTNGFGLETPDGRFSINLRGRVMADYGYINTSEAEAFFDGDAAELRRARLGIEGKAGSSNLRYRFEADFGDGDADVTDAWVQFRGEVIGKDRLTLGQFKTPNSLTEQTSSRFVGFMERPAFTDAFGFDRQIGLGLRTEHGDFRLDGGVFFGNFGDDIGGTLTDEGVTAAGRVIFTPGDVLAEGDKLHLGASIRYREAGDVGDGGLDGFEYDADLPIQLGGNDFVQVVDFGESDLFIGGELAYGFGSAHVAVDGGVLFVNGTGAFVDDDTTFFGVAGEIGYWLTGEAQRIGGGALGGRPKVNNPVFDGGLGAFQLVGRVDYIDLSDENANPALAGGEALQFTAGLNWWPTRHILLQPNVFYATLDDAVGNDSGDAADINGENEAFGVGVRAQVDW